MIVFRTAASLKGIMLPDPGANRYDSYESFDEGTCLLPVGKSTLSTGKMRMRCSMYLTPTGKLGVYGTSTNDCDVEYMIVSAYGSPL